MRRLVLPPEPGTALWLLIPTAISDAAVSLCCIDCSGKGLAQRQRPVGCHLCVLAELTQRLFNLCFFPLLAVFQEYVHQTAAYPAIPVV